MPDQPPPPPMSYVDTFNVTLGPYGAMFIFGAGSAVDPRTGQQSTHIAAQIGMSHEHLKALAFLVYRELKLHQERMEVTVQVPPDVVTQLLCPFPLPGNHLSTDPPPKKEVVDAWMKAMRPRALAEWQEFWHEGAKGPAQGANANGAAATAELPVPTQG